MCNCSPGHRTRPRPSSPRRIRALRKREAPEGEDLHHLHVHLSLLDLKVALLLPLVPQQPEHLR